MGRTDFEVAGGSTEEEVDKVEVEGEEEAEAEAESPEEDAWGGRLKNEWTMAFDWLRHCFASSNTLSDSLISSLIREVSSSPSPVMRVAKPFIWRISWQDFMTQVIYFSNAPT